MATSAIDVLPPVRVMLWAHGRSRSIVFELAMASEPSMKVFHEPFVMAYYWGEQRMCSDLFIYGPPAPGYTYQEVKDTLEGVSCPEKSAIFAKDIAGCLGGKEHYKYLPTGYVHTFLIRDPKASIMSAYRCVLAECSRMARDVRDVTKWVLEIFQYEENYNLYKYITEELNLPAIVVDSNILITNPRKTLQKYCSATGISFSENFLHWKPGNIRHFPDHMRSSQFVEVYYKSSYESCCFQPYTQPTIDLSELPDELQQHIDDIMPLYTEMVGNSL